MKSLMPWVCLVTACGAQAVFAGEGVTAYRQGQYAKAAQEFNKQSNSDAQVEYYKGRMRLYGYGQLKNNTQALMHLKKAAEKGNLDAQNILARYELLVKQDPKDALHWFEKAAAAGDIPAQMYCAAAYMFGYGTKENQMKARRYYIDAAKSGNPIAQYTLAEYFLDSRHRSNRKLGVIWLNKAVEQGNPKAQLMQGELYAQGKELEKDPVTARKLFELAIRQGSIPAMFQLGLLEQQQGQFEQAKTWYEKAAEKGYVPAQLALAKLFLKKDGPYYEPNTGFLWMLKAAQKNSKEAQNELAHMYQEGIGVAKDENLAKEWLDKAAKHKKRANSKSAKEEVALWLSNGRSSEFSASGYQREGIIGPWKNKKALTENNYNQSPQTVTVKRDQIYKPQFVLTEPNEVSLSEYYNAIANSLNLVGDDSIQLPRYSVTQLETIVVDPPSLPNSPRLAVMRGNQDYLPLASAVGQVDVLDFMSSLPEGASNRQPSVKLLKSQAILGNPDAQFKLGQMYEHGINVEQDAQKALDYYQLAADQLDLRAEYNIGLLYLEGRGIKPNYDEAESRLKNAAFKGNEKAQYALARLKEQGVQNKEGKVVIEKDHDESIAMYYLSASNNFGPAQYRLAEILVRQKAKDMSVAAVKKRNRLIKALYAGAVRNGIQQAGLPLAYFNAMDKNPQKQHRAFTVAKKAAEQGNPQGALLVGLMLDRGIGVDKNSAEAVYWYQKTTDNPVGAFILGTYLMEGKNVSKDEHAGKKLLQKSADAGFAFGNLNLAVVKRKQGESFLPELDAARAMGNSKAGLLLADYYLSESPDPEKMKQARHIYENFAQRGDKDAQLKLAFMYEQGLGGAIDYEQASQWYAKAAEQNQAQAKYLLARLHFLGKLANKPDYTQSKYLLKTASAYYPPAAVALGFIYDTVEDNYHQAKTAYQIAALHDSPVGQFNLGLMYEMGKGVPVDYEKAKSLYSKAAKQRHPQAMVQLAGIYLNGLAGSRDDDAAFDWYKKAAVLGDREALYQLGLMFEAGVATDPDIAKALSYYQKSADQGNTKAMLALARIYQYGQGVPKDKQKAFTLYEKLAEQNNPYAQYQLATFYYDGIDGQEPQPKKGNALLREAEKNGYKPASKVLQWLETQTQNRISYIEPAMIQENVDVAEQPVELMFLDAMNEWNRGDEVSSKFILDKLLMQFPQFAPAKRAYDHLDQAFLPRKLS